MSRLVAVAVASAFVWTARADVHPWDGAERTAWVRQAAERAFVFDEMPRLTQVPELFFGPVPQSFYVAAHGEAKDRELHVIGVYEGPEPTTTPDGQLIREPVELFVRRTERPVVLALTSYEGVVWEVKAENGARIDAIYCSSHESSTVRGNDVALPVRPGPPGLYLYRYEESPDEPGGADALAKLSSAIGMPVDTFQGRYRGKVFVVPAYHDSAIVRDVMAEHLRVLSERTQRPPTSFDVLQDGLIVRRGEGDDAAGARVLLEVRGASLRAVTYADVDQKYYGVSSHAAYVIDPNSGESTELVPPADFPRFSWLGGITYDASRKRVVITSLWHAGYHHTYDPITKEWRVFSIQKTGGGLHAVAYARTLGLLYGLGTDRNGGLALYDSDLTPVRSIQLPKTFPMPHRPDESYALALLGDRVAVCRTSAGGVPRAMQSPVTSVIHDCRLEGDRVVCGTPLAVLARNDRFHHRRHASSSIQRRGT